MLKDTTQIDKFKAFVKNGLSKDGECALLDVTLNNELRKLLKETTIKEFEKFSLNESLNNRYNTDDEDNDEDNENNSKLLERYKVKKVIYSSLSFNDKGSLFVKKLIDNGKFIFEFENIPLRERFKENFRNNLISFIRLCINSENEQEISFKINPDE